MSLADLVSALQGFDFKPQPQREEPWRRWRRKPGVREHLRAYKRAWRARRKA